MTAHSLTRDIGRSGRTASWTAPPPQAAAGRCAPAGGTGTIFEMVPPSSPGGPWTEVILHVFTGGRDGNLPSAVTLGPHGNLYGTTALGGHHYGTVFQLVLQ